MLFFVQVQTDFFSYLFNNYVLGSGKEVKYPPLTANDLQKKFEALANIGAKTLREENSKAYDEQFTKWRKENG